jgi:hypothetical protein
MAKIGRHRLFEKTSVVSTRIEAEFYQLIKEIAALETVTKGRLITAQELIRDALYFVYGNGERLRECFKSSRSRTLAKYK